MTIRVDQELSSSHNLPGDVFSATLVKPIVVDGVVVAQRGQTVAGRVVESEKSGRVKGTARLAIEITDLTLVDGQQAKVRSQFVSYTSGTSNGRDAGAIATTTVIGAAAGGAADGGRGAGIGAAAGAAAGVIGVLLTRGREAVIYPEAVLTFRVEAPLTISTARAPLAFRPVESRDYDREPQPRLRARAVQPVYWGGPAYHPYPYFWGGPGFAFYYGYGPRFGWGPGYYYRGYRRW